MFDSCWPKGSARLRRSFPHPLPPRSSDGAGGERAGGAGFLSPRSPRGASARAASAELPPRRTFAKVCLPAPPRPHAHAAVPRDAGRLRDALVPRGEVDFPERPGTVKAPEPGLGTGRSFPPAKGAREGAAGAAPRGRGLTRIPAAEPPPTPTPSAPAPRCAPHPRPGATRASSCRVAPPRLTRRGLSLTLGFYLQPAARSAPCAGRVSRRRRQRRRGAGDRPGDAGRSTRRARGERRGASARGLQERAGERARGSSSSRCSQVAPTGAQRAAVARVAERGLLAAALGMAAALGREVRWPEGSTCLLQRWGMGGLRPLPTLGERRRSSHQGGEGDTGSERTRSRSARAKAPIKGKSPSPGFSDLLKNTMVKNTDRGEQSSLENTLRFWRIFSNKLGVVGLL